MELTRAGARKMQEHMMKHGPPQHMRPNPEQQKIIQLQMLGHMKTQFPEGSDIRDDIIRFENGLKEGTITPDEVNIGMRTVQQKIMQVKMQ